MTSPTQTFLYLDNVGGSAGNYIVAPAASANTIVVQDSSDRSGDNLTQLGDITKDHFNITINGGSPIAFVYEGQTSNGSIVAYLVANSEKYLLTNTIYTSEESVEFTPSAHTIVCYVSGTLIRIVFCGAIIDIAVEDLCVGDIAVTASGAQRPITWIGHREVECGALAVPYESWPVRILAGAFGGDLPERDLWLSPGHPVLVGSGPNEHLVPIMCLINGTSVARMPVPAVTYWHIELDEHDLLLAEGLPAESFLDFGNRLWFGPDAAAHALANPDFVVPGLGARCRPVAIDGPVVEAERRRLDDMFAINLSAQCAWPASSDCRLWS